MTSVTAKPKEKARLRHTCSHTHTQTHTEHSGILYYVEAVGCGYKWIFHVFLLALWPYLM